jgi:non-lysosomal glucosylceramidase
MHDEAWTTLNGLYELCYDKLGLAFQMPEAILKNNSCRSLGYMRPLGIWSIQYALDDIKSKSS